MMTQKQLFLGVRVSGLVMELSQDPSHPRHLNVHKVKVNSFNHIE